MTDTISLKKLNDYKTEVLAGFTTVLALIPDSLAFAFIAGVNPMISIFSTISILLLISLFGGRPAMVSSTAGSMAVLMTALVARHGIEYLFAATVLTGVLQYLMGVCKMGRWMKFVPRSVITGFINALAILIFLSQLRYFNGQSWQMYAMVAGTLVILYVFPKITKAIPSPLVAVAFMTALVVFIPLGLQTVGDLAVLDPVLPGFHLPAVPIAWETLWIIGPTALSLAVVGYTETLLTQTIIDEKTEVKTSKDKELRGQGIANTVTGFMGGMAGCALIAESVINVKVGARGRLSTIVAALTLLLLVFVLDDLLRLIPIAALVGVMLMVCAEIFDWRYVRDIRRKPAAHTFVMLTTVVVVLLTNDLAIGVIAGVLFSTILYVYRSASHMKVSVETVDGEITYRVNGQLFFASSDTLLETVDFMDTSPRVCIDLRETRVWDDTARQTLAQIKQRLVDKGKKVRILEPRSTQG